jgi:hypothetical protein
MSRNKLGPIPDDHFENEPGPPSKEKQPLSQSELDWIETLKKTIKEKQDKEGN